ncbi:uncharacterized protein TNCV_2131241 [Trichonephila clavipes]|nr:uncharacterized protein TNCV_2131241 [Trichonephila clavipes]
MNLSRAQTSSRGCGVVVRRGVPAQVSSTSLDHGSKWRGLSPIVLLYLDSVTLGCGSPVVKVSNHGSQFPYYFRGCGSPVVKVSNHGRHVMSSIPVPLKTRRVGQRCTLNLSRAETSSRWCGVGVRRGGASQRCRPRHLTMVQNYVVRRQKPSCS